MMTKTNYSRILEGGDDEITDKTQIRRQVHDRSNLFILIYHYQFELFFYLFLLINVL